MMRRTDFRWIPRSYTTSPAIHVTVAQHTQSATPQAYALVDLLDPLVEEAVFRNLNLRNLRLCPYQPISNQLLSELSRLPQALEMAMDKVMDPILAQVRQAHRTQLGLRVLGKAIVLVVPLAFIRIPGRC